MPDADLDGARGSFSRCDRSLGTSRGGRGVGRRLHRCGRGGRDFSGATCAAPGSPASRWQGSGVPQAELDRAPTSATGVARSDFARGNLPAPGHRALHRAADGMAQVTRLEPRPGQSPAKGPQYGLFPPIVRRHEPRRLPPPFAFASSRLAGASGVRWRARHRIAVAAISRPSSAFKAGSPAVLLSRSRLAPTWHGTLPGRARRSRSTCSRRGSLTQLPAHRPLIDRAWRSGHGPSGPSGHRHCPAGLRNATPAAFVAIRYTRVMRWFSRSFVRGEAALYRWIRWFVRQFGEGGDTIRPCSTDGRRRPRRRRVLAARAVRPHRRVARGSTRSRPTPSCSPAPWRCAAAWTSRACSCQALSLQPGARVRGWRRRPCRRRPARGRQRARQAGLGSAATCRRRVGWGVDCRRRAALRRRSAHQLGPRLRRAPTRRQQLRVRRPRPGPTRACLRQGLQAGGDIRSRTPCAPHRASPRAARSVPACTSRPAGASRPAA